jgi:hypothetical protein
MGGPPAWMLGVGLTTHRKNKLVTKNHKKSRTWTDSLEWRYYVVVCNTVEYEAYIEYRVSGSSCRCFLFGFQDIGDEYTTSSGGDRDQAVK